MSKFQYKTGKAGKAEKIAKAEKLEKQAWIDKMERQEKMRSVRAMDPLEMERKEKLRSVRMMNPLEAHMLSKITAGVDMIMTGKHKEYLAEEVRGRGGGRGGRRVVVVREGKR